MRIGYRRLSGPVGLSSKEQGTRGMWWEKRRALLTELRRRGHEVRILGRPTRLSKGDPFPVEWDEAPGSYGLLMVEFGGTNERFYGKDLEITYQAIRSHDGPVAYICDDPDLWFPWKELEKEDWSRWTVLVNARLEGGAPFLAPRLASYRDFPVGSLLSMAPADVPQGDHLAYIGRPIGRAVVLRALMAARAPFRVYGRQEEWDRMGVRVWPAPPQPERGAFYAQQIGALALSDKRHKELRWRTGRAYHAITAGCPVLVEEDHPLLAEHFAVFSRPEEVLEIRERWRDPRVRAEEVRRQQEGVRVDRVILERALEGMGL